MNISKKDVLKIIVLVGLLIPILFGFNLRYLLSLRFNIFYLSIILIGSFIIFIVGRVIPNIIFGKKELVLMNNHEVVKAFSTKSYSEILIFFPITMIIEELIFRYYLLGLCFKNFNISLAVVIGAFIFSLYHIHIWFAFKNFKVLYSYLIFSFFLGLLSGYIFYIFGIVACILFHSLFVLDIYYQTYQIIEKKKVEIS